LFASEVSEASELNDNDGGGDEALLLLVLKIPSNDVKFRSTVSDCGANLNASNGQIWFRGVSKRLGGWGWARAQLSEGKPISD
jgi:hypothetical protein